MPELDELAALKARLRALEAKGRVNPFNDPTLQLALEGGGTVSARTRTMQLTCGQFPDAANARMRFTDGSALSALFGVRIPADWALDTALTLNIPLFSTAAGNMVFSSNITAHSDNETQSLGNIENVANQSHTRDANQVEVLTRTITGTAVSADETIRWLFTRQGDAGADNLGANVDAFYGAYMEYTAFF